MNASVFAMSQNFVVFCTRYITQSSLRIVSAEHFRFAHIRVLRPKSPSALDTASTPSNLSRSHEHDTDTLLLHEHETDPQDPRLPVVDDPPACVLDALLLLSHLRLVIDTHVVRSPALVEYASGITTVSDRELVG